MKNLVISTLLLMITISTYAQTSFTCKSRETCWWDSYLESYNNCSDSYFDNSVFIMNENEDMVVHRTSSMTSTYYITETEVEDKFFTYDVVSDVGNKYLLMFDLEKMLIKFMGADDEGNVFLTMYGIKATF